MANGWKLKGLDGLINLSGEQRLPLRNLDAIDNLGKLRVPFLIVSSKDDGYLPVKQAEQLAQHSGSDDTELITYSGAYHGWDLLNVAPFRARVKSQLLLWLRDHSR